MDKNNHKLLSEFPPVSTQKWEEVINQDLKGADYEKKLVWKTDEGFSVKPYYRSEDLKNIPYLNTYVNKFPYVRGNKANENNWNIRQDIHVHSIQESNKFAIEALERGCNSIGFITNDKIRSQSDLSALLKGIYFNCIEINFICNSDLSNIYYWLVEEAKKRKYETNSLYGSINVDPIGNLCKTGNWYKNENDDFQLLKNIINQLRKDTPNIRGLSIDCTIFKEAGSSILQEIAYSLSIGNEYIQKLIKLGISLEDILKNIQFNMSAGSNYFFEIAKIRAFRYLWSKIIEAYNPVDISIANTYIHTTTSIINQTAYDPYVNMLRTTTESMSAILGGTDSLSVLPFDSVFKKPNSFSYRIARNTQIILKEEAFFDKVIDPSGGSYYIESLTYSFIQEAWKMFLKIDESGGFLESLKNGFIQSQIREMAQKRMNYIASRRETLLGTNQYPNFNEVILKNIDWDVYSSDKVTSQTTIEPLKKIRLGKEIEDLRLRTEKSGKRPKVFMLTIGNLAMRLARSQFSCNFFAVAGFEVIDNNGFESIEEGIDTALKSKSDIIVLCSSDDEYAEYAPRAFKYLNNKAIFVVAGMPACIEQLKAEGINNYISIKSNLLETLKYYQSLLKIE